MPKTHFNPFGAGSSNNHLSIQRSNFNLTYKRAMSLSFGHLVPFCLEPVVPTDSFELGAEFLLRTQPFVSQVFQRYDVDFAWFYVPNRVLWNNFDLFLSGGYSGTEEFVHPYFDYPLYYNHQNFSYLQSLFDYMDVAHPDFNINYLSNETLLNEFHLNALPLYAFARIYLDHYASQHFELAPQIEKFMKLKYLCVDGIQNANLNILFNHLNSPSATIDSSALYPTTYDTPLDYYDWDYFTSALPEQQHGPIMSVPVELVDHSDGTDIFKLSHPAEVTSSNTLSVSYQTGSDSLYVYPTSVPNYAVTLNGSVIDNVATINDLRSAMILTDFFESLGYSGFKPEDYNLSQFGRKSDNRLLMQSEVIGYQRFTVNIGEVFSNNQSLDGADVPGAATSTAKGYGKSRSFRKTIPEYGYILGLVSVKPEAGYSQGIDKHWTMLDRFDYPNPRFARLGLDTIKRSEICFNGKESCLDDFGYTTRYSNYRTRYNRVNGQLRAGGKQFDMTSSRMFPKTTDSQFPTGPKLNEQFRSVHPNYNYLNRVFNAQYDTGLDGPVFLDIFNANYANRPFPYDGLPRVM